jgi:hypothetical protein
VEGADFGMVCSGSAAGLPPDAVVDILKHPVRLFLQLHAPNVAVVTAVNRWIGYSGMWETHCVGHWRACCSWVSLMWWDPQGPWLEHLERFSLERKATVVGKNAEDRMQARRVGMVCHVHGMPCCA